VRRCLRGGGLGVDHARCVKVDFKRLLSPSFLSPHISAGSRTAANVRGARGGESQADESDVRGGTEGRSRTLDSQHQGNRLRFGESLSISRVLHTCGTNRARCSRRAPRPHHLGSETQKKQIRHTPEGTVTLASALFLAILASCRFRSHRRPGFPCSRWLQSILSRRKQRKPFDRQAPKVCRLINVVEHGRLM
jgi:hypothetical protein